MVVLFEFLDDEPLDNMITCLNYRIDKVVYFGYEEDILRQKEATERFLRKYCAVRSVAFIPLSGRKLQSTLEKMSKEIEFEHQRGSKIFFDITGGESLVLVAFGMLAERYRAPIHMFDVEGNNLRDMAKSISWPEGPRGSISTDVEPQHVWMDLDRFIKMRGGAINNALHKSAKAVEDPEFAADVEKMWSVFEDNRNSWNTVLALMRTTMMDDNSLNVSTNASTVENALRSAQFRNLSISRLNGILRRFGREGLITGLEITDDMYSFRYKNEHVRDALGEGGNVLELRTYMNERSTSDDCKVGVHLDWDGEIHRYQDEDVLNEIDVLALKGNIPVFISCKGGRLAGRRGLDALYELETVANRFGGKYAKKVLVTGQSPGEAVISRAAEMGIEVRTG